MPCIKELGNNNLLISGCILRYANSIFEAKAVGRAGQERGDPRFSETFILPALDATDCEILSRTCLSAQRKRWPDDNVPTNKNDPTHQQRISALLGGQWAPAFREDASFLKSPHPQYPDRLCLAANKPAGKKPPEVWINGRDAFGDPNARTQLFAGCVVNAVIGVYCYADVGITSSFNGIQLVDNSNVTPLDGSPDVAGAFGETRSAFAPPAGAPPPTNPPPTAPGPAMPPHQAVQPGAPPAPPAPPAGVQTLPPATPDFLR